MSIIHNTQTTAEYLVGTMPLTNTHVQVRGVAVAIP